MLSRSGGQARITGYAQPPGQAADAKAIHDTKSRIFQENLAKGGLEPRPGVVAAVRGVKGERLESPASSPRPRPVTSRRCWMP